MMQVNGFTFEFAVRTCPPRDETVKGTLDSLDAAGVEYTVYRQPTFDTSLPTPNGTPPGYDDAWWAHTLGSFQGSQADFVVIFEDDMRVPPQFLKNLSTWAALGDLNFGAGFLCVGNGVLQDQPRLGTSFHSGEKFRNNHLLHNAGCVVVRPFFLRRIFEEADYREVDGARFVPFLATDFFLSFGSWRLGKRVFLPEPSLAVMDMAEPSIILSGKGDADLRGSGRHYDPNFLRTDAEFEYADGPGLWGIKGDGIHNFHVKQDRFYEQALLGLIRGMGAAGTFLDIGAHCGNHTMYFHRYCNTHKVISIEPQADCFAALMWNVRGAVGYSDPERAVLIHAAVHDTWDSCSIHVKARANLGATQIKDKGHPGKKIRCVRVDDVVDKFAEQPVVFMKIDVEGAEPAVLRSAQRTILQHLPIILTEAWTEADYHRHSALIPPSWKAFGPFTSDGTTLWVPPRYFACTQAFSGRERAR